MTSDEERRTRLQKATRADPIEHSWGVRTADPWPAGIAMFHWYQSFPALREALLRAGHALDAEPEETEAASDRLRALLTDESVVSSDSIEAANRASYPAFSIVWLGRFEDLCEGDAEIAVEMREAFDPDADPGDGAPPPVPAGEHHAFAAFLAEYGF